MTISWYGTERSWLTTSRGATILSEFSNNARVLMVSYQHSKTVQCGPSGSAVNGCWAPGHNRFDSIQSRLRLFLGEAGLSICTPPTMQTRKIRAEKPSIAGNPSDRKLVHVIGDVGSDSKNSTLIQAELIEDDSDLVDL